MKKHVALFASLIGSLALYPASGSAAPTVSLWPEAAALVSRCASQTICVRQDGSRLASPLRSVCPELVIEGATARFSLHGKAYVAKITQSEDSDGGDLNDLTISGTDGTLTENHHDVLGFDDILITLLGGNTEKVSTTFTKCPDRAQ